MKGSKPAHGHVFLAFHPAVVIEVFGVEDRQAMVDIVREAVICEGPIRSARAIVVLVDYPGDELRGEGDNHSIGNDCQHSNGL